MPSQSPASAGPAVRLAAASIALLPGMSVAGVLLALAILATVGVPPWGLAVVSCLTAAAAAVWAGRQGSRIASLVDSRRQSVAMATQFRGLYENIAAARASFGSDGAPLEANAALIRMLGYANEAEFLAADFHQHTFAGPGTFEALLLRTRLNGEVPIAEFNLRRRDGVQLMTVASVRALWDEQGDVVRFEATLLDISDLKVAERQRRSMERRFRRLFDSNAVGIMFGNLRRGTLDEANERLFELFGLRPSELPVLLDAVASPDNVPLSEAIATSLEWGSHEPPVERLLARRDGSRIGLLICAAVLDPLQGDFVGVVVERSVGDSRTGSSQGSGLYESILDSAPMMVARFDLSGGLTYCNRTFLDWFEFSSTPMGWTLEDLLGEDCRRSLTALTERVRAGATESAELDLFRVGGRLHRVEATFARHLRPDGSLGGSLLLLRDRTDLTVAVAATAVSVTTETTYTV
jgi:PAS domain S-box-containing protein